MAFHNAGHNLEGHRHVLAAEEFMQLSSAERNNHFFKRLKEVNPHSTYIHMYFILYIPSTDSYSIIVYTTPI